MALKLFKPLPKGTYVLVEMPDERKEVCLLTEVSYKISFDVEGIPVVLRKATLKEIKEYEKKLELEEKGKEFCLQFAKELGLEMNLVRVDCFFDRSKIIFFYTTEGRIDFRQLVKELARALRMRIEMRQIGVRNETAILGGIGYCGREFCCARFLKSFTPLSIKFAKEQGLILDPNKISGPCGRLLCCLSYEMEVYREFLENLPKLGSKIKINEESYRVLKYHFFQRLVYLETKDGQVITLPVEELKSYILEQLEDFSVEDQLKNLEEEED
ncbi:MAG TPA: stage 0 sporulation protein [Thermodesulfobacterium commune]|nr:stage 0 sporulation protein [Thermodesulfobacterium commune]